MEKNKETKINLQKFSENTSSLDSVHSLSRSGSEEILPNNDLDNGGGIKATVSKQHKPKVLRDYLGDYMVNSSLHGVKYIGQKNKTRVEKIFWLATFICSLGICSGLVRKAWSKWNESPVIVSFAESTTPVWQIPYPAVTICFETKAKQRKYNFTDNYHLYIDDNLTETERQLFQDVSMVCDDHLAPPEGRKFSSGLETVNTIKEVSPNMTDAFFGCKWKDMTSTDCTDLFSPILTEEGLCYTFNTLAAEDMFRLENLHTEYPYLEHNNRARSWNLEDGYGKSEPIETYPHRGSGYGVKSGLTFLLKAYGADLDYLCKGPVQGYKIMIHNPAEIPRVSQRYFRSPLSQEVVVAVKPTMMTTSEELRSYDPVRRQCYFSKERYLRYFKIYTQANCEMECLSNFTYARCGCVHFGMPRSSGMNVCSSGSMACIKKSQMELVTIEMQSMDQDTNDSDRDTLSEAREVASKCQCLPSCFSIEYEAETSQADYDWRAIFQAYRVNFTDEDDDDDRYYSRVMVFFKGAQFVTSRRSELYGYTEFLANCGGLLAFFLGFSILSFVEIIYFFTLRVICEYYMRRKSA